MFPHFCKNAIPVHAIKPWLHLVILAIDCNTNSSDLILTWISISIYEDSRVQISKILTGEQRYSK